MYILKFHWLIQGTTRTKVFDWPFHDSLNFSALFQSTSSTLDSLTSQYVFTREVLECLEVWWEGIGLAELDALRTRRFNV